jgi:uncharacterized repeat protein (TIGR03943 family)
VDNSCIHEHDSHDNWKYLIFIAPLIFLLFAGDKGLTSFAADKRQPVSFSPVMTTESGRQDQNQSQQPEAKEYPEVSMMELALDVPSYEGKKVSVIGMVYYDDILKANQFMLIRFVISCCAAHGQPVQLVVQCQKEEHLAKDTWVKVSGRAQLGKLEIFDVIMIYSEKIETIPTPEKPYLSSW